jgi:hypothetical protein
MKVSDKSEVQLRDRDFVCDYNKLQLSSQTSVFSNRALRMVPPYVFPERKAHLTELLSYLP